MTLTRFVMHVLATSMACCNLDLWPPESQVGLLPTKTMCHIVSNSDLFKPDHNIAAHVLCASHSRMSSLILTEVQPQLLHKCHCIKYHQWSMFITRTNHWSVLPDREDNHKNINTKKLEPGLVTYYDLRSEQAASPTLYSPEAHTELVHQELNPSLSRNAI